MTSIINLVIEHVIKQWTKRAKWWIKLGFYQPKKYEIINAYNNTKTLNFLP